MALHNRRILVVGGSGFIGRHVVTELLSQGAEVVVMDVAAPAERSAKVDYVIGSITDTSLLASAVAGIHTVVFLANSSLPGSANNDLSAEVHNHVQTTIKAAEIANAQNVRRFVFASSGGTVYGYSSELPLHEDMPTFPINAYGVSKLSIEHYLRLLSRIRPMETISLRVSNPYGEGQLAVRNQGIVAAAMQHSMLGKTMPIWGDGSVERDFIHVSDVARGFAAACSASEVPDVVNIGSGKALSLLNVLAQIEAALGRKVPVAFEPGRSVDVQRNLLDIERAQRLLNWTPSKTLTEGLAQTAQWWLARERDANGL